MSQLTTEQVVSIIDNFIRSSLQQGRSPEAIRQDLVAKGMNGDLASRKIGEHVAVMTVAAAARDAVSLATPPPSEPSATVKPVVTTAPPTTTQPPVTTAPPETTQPVVTTAVPETTQPVVTTAPPTTTAPAVVATLPTITELFATVEPPNLLKMLSAVLQYQLTVTRRILDWWKGMWW